MGNRDVFGQLHRSWLLVWALTEREFKGQYRRTLLGPTWAFLLPLVSLIVFLFLRRVLDIKTEGIPYPIFAYSALVPWTFFSNAVTRCGPSVFANAALLKKLAVRREVFPASGMLVSFVDLLFASPLLVGLMIWFKVPVNWTLLWLPLLLLLTGLAALGFGMILAAVGTYKRDVILGIPFLLQFWMLASPIMYSRSTVPQQWLVFYNLNPVVGLLEAHRNVLVRGTSPDLQLLGISLLGILAIWLIALPLFRYMSQYFADVL